jgi:hypothetical protein
MDDGRRRSLLLVHFARFVRAHLRCGAFIWDTEDSEDGVGLQVTATCLRCDAKFLETATALQVASALVHSRLLTSVN